MEASTGNHAKRNDKYFFISQKIASGHVIHHFNQLSGDLARPEILASEILYPVYNKDTIYTNPEILACATAPVCLIRVAKCFDAAPDAAPPSQKDCAASPGKKKGGGGDSKHDIRLC